MEQASGKQGLVLPTSLGSIRPFER
jgi:hypothetical protein